jgi:anthranilate phosphoribosyltransferase
MTNSHKFDLLISHFKANKDLDTGSVVDFIGCLSDPNTNEDKLAELTSAWKCKGETSNEIAGIAQYILTKLPQIKVQGDVLDCCGTGGDNSNTFNISTSSAFLAATAGLRVAKHGGRRTTSASGSIDLVEALGIKTYTEPQKIEAALQKIGLAFIASPALHGILGRWKAVCRKLQFHGQTGLIGTLTNPVYLTHQMIGVPKEDWGPLMIEALKILGRKKALVVFGYPKLDEASLCGPTQIWQLEHSKITQFTIEPADFGLQKNYLLTDIAGGDPTENAKTFLQLIRGQASKPIVETVCLNTGLLLWLSGQVGTIELGITKVKEIIETGEALDYWNNFVLRLKEI